LSKQNVEDFRDFSHETLGKVKNLGQTNPHVGSDFVYGFKPKEKEPWDASKCLRGDPIVSQVKEDENLGKSTKHGFRNSTKEGDERRVFGVPTIRNDVKKPSLRSVADSNNYGDEPPAIGVLFPQRFSEMGIDKADFDTPRTKEEIRQLFSNIGYNYKAGKFEGLFMRAQEICGSQSDEITVRAFIQAVKEMDHL